MRKLQILCLVLVTIPAIPVRAASRPSDRERAGLTGEVRSVHTRVALVSDDGKAEVPMPAQIDVYDERGDLHESKAYSDGILRSRRERSYDASGNRIERLYVSPEPNAPLPLSPTTVGGARANLTTARLDSAGRPIEEVLYAGEAISETAILGRSTFEYDASGRVRVVSTFSADGERRAKAELARNAAGEVVEARTHGADDSAPTVVTYAYGARDASGNWTERTATTAYPVGAGKRPLVQREYRTIVYRDVGVGDKTVRTRPDIRNRPRADYPHDCAVQGIGGSAVVKALLSADGKVTWAEATTGLPCGLNAKAIEAVYKLKFAPATNPAGKPVDCWVTVDVVFVR